MKSTFWFRCTSPLIFAGALCWVTSASAEESYGGYLRAGFGSSADSKSRSCYALNGAGLKYRLGNECDTYGEVWASHSATYDGIQISESLMLSEYTPDSANGTGIKIAQLWIETRGWSFSPEATVWAGKERGRRGDVHLVDAFFVEMVGVGAGIKRIPLGAGRAGVAVYASESGPTVRRLNVEYEDVPLSIWQRDTNPSETISFFASAIESKQPGWAITALHSLQLSADVKHRLWIQLASGSGSLNVNVGNVDRPISFGVDWRIASSAMWQRGRWGGEAMAMLAREGQGELAVSSVSGGARVAFAPTSFLKLQAEFGTTQTRQPSQPVATLNKLTLAPTLALKPDYWSRPELRFYVTSAQWNTQAVSNAAFNAHLDSSGSGTTWGAHFEIWF